MWFWCLFVGLLVVVVARYCVGVFVCLLPLFVELVFAVLWVVGWLDLVV